MSRVTQFAALTFPAPGDLLPIVDIDDTTMASTGTDKKITVAALLGLPPSGDTTGATDPGNIQGLLNLAGIAMLQAGTFYMGGSSALAMSVAGGVLMGSTGTTLQIVSGFSGAELVNITANFCAVRNLSIVGASSTITSNPVMNGIELTGAQYCKVSDVFFQYINGWATESVGGSSTANIGCRFENLTGYNCAGGLHIKGVTGSGFGGQQWVNNPQFSQIGAATGASANLDAIRIEDISDIYIASFDGAISDVGTGSTLNIMGTCSSVFVNDFDLGCFPATTPINSIVTVQNTTNGSPSGVHFDVGILQSGLIGCTVSGAASRIYFTGVDFANNSTHGCVLSGSGSGVYFNGDCTFRGNGAGASGTNYDLNISGTTTGFARGIHFLTAVTTSGTAGVQDVVNVASSGQNFPFEDCDFSGTGVALSTVFTNLPTWVRNCKNYTPHGSVTVSVPASAAATSALHYDAIFYITAGATSCTIVRNTNGFGGGAGPTITVPANACVPVFVRAGATITPTYTNAPTWVVDGQ